MPSRPTGDTFTCDRCGQQERTGLWNASQPGLCEECSGEYDMASKPIRPAPVMRAGLFTDKEIAKEEWESASYEQRAEWMKHGGVSDANRRNSLSYVSWNELPGPTIQALLRVGPLYRPH